MLIGSYSTLRALFAFVGFTVMAALIPILIYQFDKPLSVAAIYSWLIIVYSSLRVSYGMLQGYRYLLKLTFWMFIYVWYGLSSFSEIITNVFPWPGTYSTHTELRALIGVSIGILAYEVGGRIYRVRNNKVPQRTTDVSDGRFKTLSVARYVTLSVLTILFTFYMIHKTGGWAAVFLNRSSRSMQLLQLGGSTMGMLLTEKLDKVPIFIDLLLGILVWKHSDKRQTNWVFVLLLIVLFAMNIVINNPISNPRNWFGSVAVAILLVVFRWNKWSYAIWSVGFLIILLVIYPYAALFRTSLSARIVTHSLLHDLTTSGDYDVYQQTMNAIIYTSHHGIDFGRQISGAFLFWIPRSIWTLKPLGTGQTIATALGYSYTNLSCSLWAEGFVAGGMVGIIVVFLLYGYLSCKMDTFFDQRAQKSSNKMMELIMPFLSGYQLFLLRGDLMNGIAYLSPVVLFGLIYFVVVYTKRTRASTLVVTVKGRWP